MSTPLFLDKKISFEKISMETKLSDNAEAWQQEITSEMFRQLPFLSDYSVNVMLDKVDPEKGFAFGKADVSNIQESPEKDPDPRSLSVPLIVKDRMLKPMDILMNQGKPSPLSEDRVRKSLFRKTPFELSTRKPSDKMMADKLQPPSRSHMNAQVSSGGFGKFASKKPSLLKKIASTIPEAEAQKFIDKLASDISLKTALLRNSAFSKCAYTIAAAKSPNLKKTAAIIDTNIKPTVVQFTKLGGGKFKVKWANANAFSPQQSTIPADAAKAMIGPAASDMKPGQSLTATANPTQSATPNDIPAPISAAGQYKCQDDTGNPLIGNVFPVMDFDMTPMSMFLFTDGIVYALQEQISGTSVGEATPPPPGATPAGYGVFVNPGPEAIFCTQPITIVNQATSPDGEIEFHAETDLGEPIILSVVPELQEMVPLEGNHIGLPASYVFAPLGDEVSLLAEPTHFSKVAELRNFNSIVEIRKTGADEYSFTGSPVTKLASNEKTFINRGDTEFLLATMGMGPRDIYEKLAQLDRSAYIKIAGLRSITPLSELKDSATKIASEKWSNFPWHLRRDLVKEAAALHDEDTVDNVLSLGFLNQDNIHSFANYLPELEQTGGKLANLLLASRMGLSPVPEEAVLSAMRNTDEVVTGLRELQQKVSADN